MDRRHHLRVYGDMTNTLNDGIWRKGAGDAVAGGSSRVAARGVRGARIAGRRQRARLVSALRHQPADGVQVAAALPKRRSGGPGRPVAAAAPIAAAHTAGRRDAGHQRARQAPSLGRPQAGGVAQRTRPQPHPRVRATAEHGDRDPAARWTTQPATAAAATAAASLAALRACGAERVVADGLQRPSAARPGRRAAASVDHPGRSLTLRDRARGVRQRAWRDRPATADRAVPTLRVTRSDADG
jgi:hypothetical protein